MLEITLTIANCFTRTELLPWELPSQPQDSIAVASEIVEWLTRSGKRVQSRSHQEVRFALDEWLLTPDVEDLSAVQSMLCGCALLENFCSDYRYQRSSPTLESACRYILIGRKDANCHLCWPQIVVLLNHAISSEVHVQWFDDERSLLQIMIVVFSNNNLDTVKQDIRDIIDRMICDNPDYKNENSLLIQQLSSIGAI